MRPWLGGLFLMASLASCRLGTGSTGDSCKEHSDCDSDLVCASSKCGTPYARRWRLSIESARITPTDSRGDSWDGDGSAPDPYVTVKMDGSEVLKTQVKDNTLTPAWGESVTLLLNNSTRVQVSLFDDDFLFPQGITETIAGSISPAELRQGEVVAFAPTGGPDAGVNSYTSVTFRWDLVE
jgi:hypothetical protein